MAGGDRFALDIAVGPGARLVVTTAAAEKVYRTLGPAATVDVRLTVGAGGALAWLPQETILFDRARLRRSIEIDLAEDARLLLAEAIVFGRSGMGEAVDDGRLFDRWRLRRDGRLDPRRSLRLDGAVAAQARGARGRQRRRRGRDRAGGAGRRGDRRRACARSTDNSAARSASPPGTASRSCGSAPPTAPRCATISSRCWRAVARRALPRLWLN